MIRNWKFRVIRIHRTCKDRNKYGGGKIVFVKEGLIARRLRDFDEDTTEITCLEPTICKKNWFMIFA